MTPRTPAAMATCSIQTLEPLVRTLWRLGVDAERVLASQGLSEVDLADVDLRIPVAQSIAVWNAAYAESGEPALGIRVVAGVNLESLKLFTYLSASSETPRQAFERAIRFARIIQDPGQLELRVEGPYSLCCIALDGRQRSRAQIEFFAGLMARIAPRVMGGEPTWEVWFRDAAPPYAHEIPSVFGCPVHYGRPWDALAGPSAGLDSPLPRSDSSLCALLEEHAAQQLARVPACDDFAGRVRERISRALPRGEASADGVADTLHMSPRTLRRRLRLAGLSFQKLLDEVRFDLARHALTRSDLSINEVAFLVGFSDASAFHKAFRRWSGCAPSDYARVSARP